MTTLHLRTSIGRSPLRLDFLLIPLMLACFAVSPQAQATCQEGCLTNQNTVLGEDALFSLTSGIENTALGYHALSIQTLPSYNTAVGANTLAFNISGYYSTAVGADALVSESDEKSGS